MRRGRVGRLSISLPLPPLFLHPPRPLPPSPSFILFLPHSPHRPLNSPPCAPAFFFFLVAAAIAWVRPGNGVSFTGHGGMVVRQEAVAAAIVRGPVLASDRACALINTRKAVVPVHPFPASHFPLGAVPVHPRPCPAPSLPRHSLTPRFAARGASHPPSLPFLTIAARRLPAATPPFLRPPRHFICCTHNGGGAQATEPTNKWRGPCQGGSPPRLTPAMRPPSPPTPRPPPRAPHHPTTTTPSGRSATPTSAPCALCPTPAAGASSWYRGPCPPSRQRQPPRPPPLPPRPPNRRRPTRSAAQTEPAGAHPTAASR